MRRLALLLFLVAVPAVARTRVILLQFSDYHSHAAPFYSEGMADQGGIARAIGYLEREHRRGAIVFSGGDMVNKGSPAWSDKYQCAEWPWFNGIVSAMALGNHDPDYGAEALAACRKQIAYPILSASTRGFKPTAIVNVKRIRIGVLAVAGSDFKTLVKTPGFEFDDRIAAARDAVRTLRNRDHADVVVVIGHESTADDEALARAVPGIDLIFGSHSHLKADLHKINGTETWSISPSQYLTYLSRVELTFAGHKLVGVTGRLVPVNALVPVDRKVEGRVDRMQRDLERDPQYAALFVPITTLREALSVDQLAQRAVNVMRKAAGADLALSTASSFRQPLPRGRVTLEDLRASMPYDNEIVVATMSGEAVKRLIGLSESKRGTDDFAFFDKPADIEPDRQYRVATTDFLAHIAPGYRDFFQTAQPTGLRVREEFRKLLATPVVEP